MSLVDDFLKLSCEHRFWMSLGKSIYFAIIILVISLILNLNSTISSLLFSINATFWSIVWLTHLTQYYIFKNQNCIKYKIEEGELLKKKNNFA